MAEPHRIKLIGPWEYELVAALPDQQRQRTRMPGEWRRIFGEDSGNIRFSRVFQWPNQLDDNESLHMVLTGVGGTGRALVNGVELLAINGDKTLYEFEFTPHVKKKNELVVELQFDPANDPDPGGLWGLVVLEIRTATESPA